MSQNEELYKEFILDLYRNPLNKKEVVDADIVQREFNPVCGDDITLMIKFNTEDKVEDIGHTGSGCAISQAAVSLLTDELKGKTKEEISEITAEQMIEMLGIPISHTRLKCALLGLTAAQKGITT